MRWRPKHGAAHGQATSAPSSKMRIASARTWTSKTASRRVRHAVEDCRRRGRHAFVRGAPLQSEDGLVWRQRQRLQRGLFLSEGLIDDTVGRGCAGAGWRSYRHHSRTKTKSPQTNGIVERFHKTVLDELIVPPFARRSIDRSPNFRTISISWVQSYNGEKAADTDEAGHAFQ